ncbi:hypothetical protein Pflav_046940 [Phytohabitans flavus]|uniref:AB hydrolase-1 domain-containing protein n=1 Tax=Phytohabitans flavus TaxID=1076124 RepID=A0A6F8XWR0_9ACTN|nr:hypothetical protein Pflav_046940 [Phytohabitans flavus]
MSIPPIASTTHRHLDVDGVRVFYRESHPDRANAPVLLLMHGFPSGSHQFRRLIDVLGARYRLIAPTIPASATPMRPPASPTPSTGSPTSPKASSNGSASTGS